MSGREQTPDREALRYLEARIDRADDATSAAMDERDEARAALDRVRALHDKAQEQYGWMGVVSVLDLRDALDGDQ